MKTQDIEMFVAIDSKFRWNADPTEEEAVENLIGNYVDPAPFRVIKVVLKDVAVPEDLTLFVDCPPIAEVAVTVHGEAVNA